MSIEPNGPQLTPTEADIRHHVHQYWKAYAIQGAVQLVLGLIAVAAPFAATYVTVIFFGALLVSAGILGLVGAFSMRGLAGRRSGILFSVLILLLGLVVLFDPFAGAVSLTVLIAVFFLLSAFANFAFARAMHHANGRSTLLYLSAALNIALAVFLVVGLPGTAVVAIGLFLGFSFALSGAALLAAALGARRS